MIECRGDRLVLAGNDAEPYYGTRYAVVELLHRLGVRWFLPGELGEVVPKSRTLTVPEMTIHQRPDFRMRNYWQHSRGNMAAEDTEWKIHHKMNPRMHQWFGVPGDSSIRGYLPKQDAFKAHPEWFALRRDGGRDEHMRSAAPSLPAQRARLEPVAMVSAACVVASSEGKRAGRSRPRSSRLGPRGSPSPRSPSAPGPRRARDRPGENTRVGVPARGTVPARAASWG